ncbi:SDR family oxidoreductase [Hymenobacter defluvii]|uniref:SDR family oxidoreductase n=1 Tax=Hymenobacter defluvii TaxID=2054411 RepID=A0ABS3TI33_9BACT|nr:SDR family oxidoreductase [Hymenobacter defluvii]MBO3273292.1 SDR family oxidoreductase [Hymenobacter defluvii]
MKLKPIQEQTIVITGATSGIGLATAKLAAEKGAKLVLAARSEEDLQKVAQELGGEVATVAADVANADEVRRIAETALARFGRIDTWVNNAGVGIVGMIEQGSVEDYRKLFDTNFWGVVNGSLEALKHLKPQGGALINLGSEVSDLGVALQGVYSASKHAIKGFTDSLRAELEHEEAPVSVTLIKPAGINTPFMQNARNYLDRQPKLPDPVYAPEEVAYAIVHAAAHPERDVYVGGGSKLFSSFNKVAPTAVDWVNAHVMPSQEVRPDQAPSNPQGGLHQPGVGGRVHGDHPGYVFQKSYYTRASLHPVASGALLALVGGAVALWLSKK